MYIYVIISSISTYYLLYYYNSIIYYYILLYVYMVELEYFSVGSICFFNVWPVGISSSQLKAHHSERRWELQDFFLANLHHHKITRGVKR